MKGQRSAPSIRKNAVCVSCGAFHAAAVTAEGRVVCWGDNDFGQCDVPADLFNVVCVSCFCYDSVTVTSDGRVLVSGYNEWANAMYHMMFALCR
jgi:alpha-tubulin suppressor-like RCC1 family protein